MSLPTCRPVAVVLDRLGWEEVLGPEDLRLLKDVTGDWDTAYQLATERERYIVKPVTQEAAEVILRWLATGGLRAMIDDGYYDDQDDTEVWDESAFERAVSA